MTEFNLLKLLITTHRLTIIVNTSNRTTLLWISTAIDQGQDRPKELNFKMVQTLRASVLKFSLGTRS